MSEQPILVGNEEWCAFPELALPAVKARIDSGAKTSSLHAINIHAFRRQQRSWVSFEVHPIQNDRRVVVRCERPVIDRRSVKSTSGVAESRYVISVPMRLGGNEWEIELTLANRDSMGYRMLLGREAMAERVIIDPSKRFCQGLRNAAELRALYGHAEVERSGLTLGLLGSDADGYSNRRLLEAGEERGHDMVFLDLHECYIRLDMEDAQVQCRAGQIPGQLDAVITRVRPTATFLGCALARQFEGQKVLTVNGSDAIARSRDRLQVLQCMLQNGISIPTTGFAKSPTETQDLIELVGGAPLIVKLLDGSQGRGVVLAETEKAAESVINAFKTLDANLLVQQFVREANGKDLRCLVIDGKVVASIERTAAAGDFRANLQQGGSASLVRITPEERKLAVTAARLLGLQVAGVDLVRSRNGPLLLEVSPAPGLEAIENATGKDLASLIILSVEKRLGWQRERGDRLMRRTGRKGAGVE